MTTPKTYAATQGKQPFDWNEFLNKEARNDIDWHYARRLALDWVTCACGTQCAIIPRNEGHAPKDDILRRLGANFFTAIRGRMPKYAYEILKDIEVRSAELIAELTSKTPES